MPKDKDQLTVYLPSQLGQRVRKHAAALGKELTEVCSEAIEGYMDSPAPRIAELERRLAALTGQVGKQDFSAAEGWKSIEARLREVLGGARKGAK